MVILGRKSKFELGEKKVYIIIENGGLRLETQLLFFWFYICGVVDMCHLLKMCMLNIVKFNLLKYVLLLLYFVLPI